ncbi:hypothetical protein ABE41_004715 [Fictibacillus arsenicus]|jgi:hypothetical protein|uniref:DUF2187 domain-containing protein n=1 Tax=Fictibacillus arsenicus TaxID=255247 RepID=A0A1B1Z1F4_9BACL|nr:hypothetical protein [Fictibacillus arsenicus]ANX11298.1 hypothetical protein ABE41_004715 [Fictibacillus arsenicus]
MNFTAGDKFIFEEIKVKVIEVKADSVIFEVSETGYEGDEGGLMEVPNAYLKEKKDQIRRCP